MGRSKKEPKEVKNENLLDNLKKELKRDPKPRMSEIGMNFVRHAGGIEMFSKHLWDMFSDADAGSVSRQRIMSLVIQTLRSDPDDYGTESLEDLDTDDLKVLLARRLDEIDFKDELHGTQQAGTADAPGAGPAADRDPSDQDPAAAGAVEGDPERREKPRLGPPRPRQGPVDEAAEGDDEDGPAAAGGEAED